MMATRSPLVDGSSPFLATKHKLGKTRMPDLADYMTTEEAAQALAFHVEHIRRMRRQGKLTGKKVGAMWFISKQSVEEYKRETQGMEKFDPRRGNN